MEGLRWERTVLLSTPTMRTDFFRPMRRAVTDLNLARKRRNKFDSSGRSSKSNNVVPVVSVQYDVPKTPPSPVMYRYRRHHTPCTGQSTPQVQKFNKTEDKNNFLSQPTEFPLKLSARLEREIEEERRQRQELRQQDHLANVDNHRIKGLGVGKGYAEYHPPQTAPVPVTEQRVPPATASAQDQMNHIIQSMKDSSPLGFHGYINPNQGQGQGSICSQDALSSTRAQKGSIPSPSLTSMSHYQQHWSLSQTQTPSEEARFHNRTNRKFGILERKSELEDATAIDCQAARLATEKLNRDIEKIFGLYRNKDCANYKSVPSAMSYYMGLPSGGMKGRNMYGRPSSTQESVKLRLITVQQRPLSLALSSSSTPTVPYSTADILYGSEVNARPPIEEVRQNSLDLERTKELSRIKSKELEQHPNNRRPNSKSASKKSLSIEAVTIEREKEDAVKGYSNTLPPTKPSNHFRPNGIRSNILKGEPMFSAKSNGALSGRDPDDLVAMGTLWSPNNQNPSQSAPTPPQQMSRSGIQNNVSSNAFPSKSNPSSSSVNPSMSASTTMTPQRKYTSNNVRPIVVQNNTISGIRNNLKEKEKEKDAEPKYSDPLIGAPASYQQRLIELGALEGDTVRWERTKRLKKKKQDRDS